MTSREIERVLIALANRLSKIVEQDPEQEVRGMAIPVIDQVIVEAKKVIGDNPIVERISDLVSVEALELGEPVRAVDALLVVETLHRLLRPEAKPGGRVWSPDI